MHLKLKHWRSIYYELKCIMIMHFNGKRGDTPDFNIIDRDDGRVLLDLKFSISGFFGLGKFWHVFF